jgi:hypothetical protein
MSVAQQNDQIYNNDCYKFVFAFKKGLMGFLKNELVIY